MKRTALVLTWTLGCSGSPDTTVVDAPVADGPFVDALGVCGGPGREKIKFTRPESCGGDGSVEWCIPDNDPQLAATLAMISPAIHCAAGGGRAQCDASPGLLLCMYPTSYPEQCLSPHGEMTPEVWDDMCELAALPQVVEIVSTFFE